MKKIKSTLLNPVVFSILINCIILGFYCITNTIKYEVSDDFVMELIVSGAYSGQPSPYIMFMNPIIGELLKALYSLNQNINWYTFLQIGVIEISMIMISYIILKLKPGARYVVVMIFVLFFSSDFLQLMQFTKTATLSICTSFFAFVYYLNNKNKGWFLVSWLFAMTGIMIRYNTLFYVCAVMLIPGIYFFILNGFNEKILNYLLYIGMLAGSLLFCIGFSNYYFDSHPLYKEYRDFSKIRAQIVDYGYVDYNVIADQLNEIGMDENAYNMIYDWNFNDPEFYTLTRMKQVKDILDEVRTNSHLTFKDTIKWLYYRRYWRYIVLWGGFLIFLLGLYNNPKRWLYYISTGIIALALLYYCQYSGRLVYRVEFGIMFSMVSAWLCLLVLSRTKKEVALKWQYLLAGLLVLTKIYGFIITSNTDKYQIMYYSADNNLKKYNLQFSLSDFKDLNQEMSNKENAYFLDFQSLIQTYYLSFDPMQPIPEDQFNNIYYFGGVDIYNPATLEKMKRDGIENPMLELLKPNVYLVNSLNSEDILEFLKTHYNKNVDKKLINRFDGYEIWKYELEKE